jgi:hypothetical protein
VTLIFKDKRKFHATAQSGKNKAQSQLATFAPFYPLRLRVKQTLLFLALRLLKKQINCPMKKFTILLFAAIAYCSLPAQTPQKEAFLVVKAVGTFDEKNQQYCYFLQPSGSIVQDDVKALVSYNRRPFYHEKAGADYYFLRSDTSKTYFNYFRSQEEVLQYLTERKWTLITVISEISSSYDLINKGYQIASAPVFYLKRQ